MLQRFLDSWTLWNKTVVQWQMPKTCPLSCLTSFKIRHKRQHRIWPWNALHWKGRKCSELDRLVEQWSKLTISCQKECRLPWQLKRSPNSAKIWQSCRRQWNVQWCVSTRLRSETPTCHVPKISAINRRLAKGGSKTKQSLLKVLPKTPYKRL